MQHSKMAGEQEEWGLRRTELAIALFQQRRITLGTASQLAGLHQIEFQRLISSRGICIHYDAEDLEQDLASLRQDGW